MSVVIALKDNNGVLWMGCDRQATRGETVVKLQHDKVWFVPERPPFLMGGVGYARGLNLLETNNYYIDELVYLRDEIDYDYIVNQFPLAIDALFKQNGFTDPEQKVIDLRNESLLCTKNTIFQIDFDGAVMEHTTYAAIGSGGELALGSLQSSIGLDPKSRLLLAIGAAYSNCYCGQGYVIINSKGEVFTDEDEPECKDEAQDNQ